MSNHRFLEQVKTHLETGRARWSATGRADDEALPAEMGQMGGNYDQQLLIRTRGIDYEVIKEKLNGALSGQWRTVTYLDSLSAKKKKGLLEAFRAVFTYIPQIEFEEVGNEICVRRKLKNNTGEAS